MENRGVDGSELTAQSQYSGRLYDHPGCHGSQAGGGAIDSGPEDGVGRPPGRRRGPRLQQHAGGDPRAYGDWPWNRPIRPTRSTTDLQEIRKAARALGESHAPAAGLCPQADDRPQGAGPERNRGRHAQDAATAHRRGYRPHLAAGGGSVAGQDGSVPDRPDPGQSVRQRPRRHRRCRQDHHRDGKHRLRRGLLRRFTRDLSPATMCGSR